MAKIYETKKDLEREQIAAQPERYKEQAKQSFYVGLISALMVPISHEIHKLRVFKAERVSEEYSRLGRFLDKAAPYIFGVVSAISLISAYMFNNDSKKKAAERSALGPEELVLPVVDAQATLDTHAVGRHVGRLEKECKPCALKGHGIGG